ncbi:650d1b4a-fcd2-468a-9761-fb579c62b0fd [Thermothielavioides terrestris]|uniref:650d1b4a-fcd2-468a-9761-fb579c62b0fd n=1 Tax=Thermothielavioides terrestris TaxID=2587410 RepID=A0A3S4BFR7_9PEZI|nr:650d1b4a-fcd2-468a-9761-fb579c62b0fd [Thermothielavioides terrestris]
MPADVAVLAAGPEASRMALDDEHTTPDAPLNGSRAASGSSILGTKRKLRDPDAEAGLPGAAGSQTPLKKTRLARDHSAQPWTAAGSSLSLDRSLLPPEIWHHIFTFCPPKSLGKLLAVNKLFNLYLDPASSSPRDVPGSATRGVLEPMEPNAIWQASRRLFWSHMPAPLRSKTELDMWRLACSPRCQECGKLDARERSGRPDPRHPGPGPEGVTAIWTFGSRLCGSCLLKSSIKDIDLLISSSLPSAVIPALPFVFITQDLDAFSATTLEQGQLPPSSPVTKWFSSSDVKALEEEFAQVRDMGQGTVGEWLKGLDGRGSALQHDASKWEKWELSGGTAKMCSQLYPGYARKVPLPQPQKLTTDGSLSPPTLRQSLPLGRHERTAEEIVELKAARRAEIERRALLLDPPLTADVLRHIPSFQAATQIVARFDDDAWERLKPRLLAQRADAEKLRDGELAAKSEPKQDRREQRRLEVTLATTMEARDRIDKAWEEAQAPLRAKIAGFADDVIRDSWGKGKKVTRENCSRFAVDALLQEAYHGPPEGPFTQKLTLENMKWIFDTKIKPHTEPFRKELFYCSGCVGNFKQFGFEGVIQHYAAKHTNALSLGSIVVHWRAEWPARPPFSATARPPKATFNPHARSGYAVNGGAPPFAGYNYPPQQGTMPAPPAAYPPAMGYGYATQTNNDYYQQPPHPPQPYQPSPIVPHFPPQPGYDQQPSYPPPPPTAYPPYQPPVVPYPGATAEPAQIFPPPGGHYNHQYGTYQPGSTGDSYAPSQPSAFPDPYQTKVEDIARNSREVWRALGDIKDLPGSVRVFVTIHHLVKRFRSRFYETPPLTMFIDGLSNNKEMRPVRNVNGLVCKACHLGLGNANTVEQDRKRFSLPQLANHFQSKHVEPAQTTPAPLDWVLDMVLLPDLTVLSHLASSISKAQRALLAAAIPSAFAPQPVSTTAGELPEQQQDLGLPPSAAEGCQSMPATARDASSTSNGNPTSSATKDESSTVSKYMGVDHHSSAQSSLIATPGAMSDNGHSSAGNEKGGHSSRQSRLVHGGVRHDAYSPGRTHHAGFSESPVLRSEERRFRLPDSRANSRSHGTVTAETEYYRQHEDMRMPPRPPIEAYEIVQVIDEHGEYYIRRPVRRHPDARYVYDERRVHRDIVSSAAAEPGYAPVSRSSLPREAVQARPAAGSWPADRGADSAYYEEYDPRFPAA